MTEHVALLWKRNRGWPFDEPSYGMDPMFGPDGWCHTCGVPIVAQSGNIMLQRRNLTVAGVWAPNWLFDVICMERSVGEELARRADVQLREVSWKQAPPGDALQLLFPSTSARWFAEGELRSRAIARHGVPGATCPDCGRWKWMPLVEEDLPPILVRDDLGEVPIVASPEWFGDGGVAFRQVLVRRDLAEFLHGASPRDFDLA